MADTGKPIARLRAKILQCFFAQFIRIAFTGLGKRDELSGNR